MKIIRHGDVLLREVKVLPQNAQLKVKTDKHIVAWGEFTGHNHLLAIKEKTKDLEIYEAEGVTYLVVNQTATITHQEHKILEVPEATYQVVIEREFDPFLEQIRQVQD